MDNIGKYEIIEKIGSGGFGEVFKGFDPFIKRHVAVKTCRSNDEEIRGRFFQEAEIAGNLHHRNVTTVYDFGVHGDLPYLIQEYLSGEDLTHKIKRRDSLSFAEKLSYLLQIGRGLQHAHSKGVVHRDIKPGNIRILEDGSAKIMDFGIAKLAQRESSLTQTGMTLGTAAYLAPEQIRGDSVDQRTDIFSFGVLMYEFLSYERPFKGEQISAVLYQILHGEVPVLQAATAAAPEEMVQIIRRCLEKDPDQRYSTAGNLLRDLEKVREGSPADPETLGLSQTIPLHRPKAAPTSFAEEVTPPKPLPTQPWPGPAQPPSTTQPPESSDRLDLVELQSSEPASGRQKTVPKAPSPKVAQVTRPGKGPIPWAWLLPALALILATAAWWLYQEPARWQSLLAATGLSTSSDEPATSTETPPVVAAQEQPARTEPPSGNNAPEADLGSTASLPSENPAIDSTALGIGEEEGAQEGEANQEQAEKQIEEVTPPPPPPSPASLRVTAASWADRTTLRLGSKGPLYTLEVPLRLNLQANLYRLSFQIEHRGYQDNASMDLRLRAGEQRSITCPIPRPGTLSVRARPGLPQGQVLINGADMGSTPISRHFLRPGQYLIEIRPTQRGSGGDENGATGVDPATPQPASSLVKNVTLEAGFETTITFDLKAMTEPVVRVKETP
jgi:serine/threonine-protein kinase